MIMITLTVQIKDLQNWYLENNEINALFYHLIINKFLIIRFKCTK